MKTLFENKAETSRPLAFRMRPSSIADFVGQKNLVGKGRQLRRMLESRRFFSVIFYGPPGSGKTALANVIASTLDARIEKINAVNSSVKEIREVLNSARNFLLNDKSTLLIIDEIHRFSRNQQEALLPDVEEGNVTLVGITTENPFYFISGPLISRARVYRFEKLSVQELEQILTATVSNNNKGLGDMNINVTPDVLELIAKSAEGDARYALNILETAAMTTEETDGRIIIDEAVIQTCIPEKKFLYDKTGTQHYDTISAFIKSIRGSDPDAAVYYLAKMIISGEDPRFIARRMAICASEDIGNADPQALILANSALNATEYVGMPEARIILAQVAVYLTSAPKSNASYMAINSALEFIHKDSTSEIPRHLTKAGAADYKYPHDYEYGYARQQYMVPDKKFYIPVNRGHEKYIRKYLDFIRKLNGEQGMGKVKELLREKHIKRRGNLSCSERKSADKSIFEALKKHAHIQKHRHIMLYISVAGEVDTYNIIEYLLSEGKKVYVPVVGDSEIIVSEINNINDLVPGRFIIPEPSPDKRKYVDPMILEVVIVPGVCFTSEGSRIGRGGGYYDRFLKRISTKTYVIGICYRSQIENEIPHDEKDMGVHEVITEG